MIMNDNEMNDLWMDNSWLQLTPSKKQCTKESNITSNSNYASPQLSYECSHVSSVEDIYKTPNEPLETLVKQS